MRSREIDPVRVYLDSSDISNLSDPHKLAADPLLQKVREEIIDLSEKGVVEFRFSFFHIIELAHLESKQKPHAEARAKFVKLLCGHRAYRHPGQLRLFEALSLVQDGQPETVRGASARAYVNDASWLPRSIIEVATDFSDALTRGLNNRIVKESLGVVKDIASNRKERRALSRKFAGPKGATEDAIKIAAKTAKTFLEDWQSAYPLTNRFWDDTMLFQVLQNRISKQELQQECLNGFADIENFIGWCVDRIPSIRAQPQAIRSTEHSTLFDELRAEADKRLELARKVLDELELKPEASEDILKFLRRGLRDAVSPDMNKSRRRKLEDLYQSNRVWFTKHHVTEKDFERKVLHSPLGTMPSLDIFLHVISAHFKKLGKLSTNPPKLRHSDLCDLLHSVYIPYSDVFSVDTRTRLLVTPGQVKCETELVVGSLALLEAIRAKIAARKLS
jgi:hypothetical protein